MSNGEPPEDDDKKVPNESKQPQPNLDWIPTLLNSVMPLAKEYVDLQKSKFDFKVRRDEKASVHNRKLTFSLLIFLGVVIGIVAILALYGKVSGDALLFMIGVVVGYIITMIQGLIYEPWENDVEGD